MNLPGVDGEGHVLQNYPVSCFNRQFFNYQHCLTPPPISYKLAHFLPPTNLLINSTYNNIAKIAFCTCSLFLPVLSHIPPQRPLLPFSLRRCGWPRRKWASPPSSAPFGSVRREKFKAAGRTHRRLYWRMSRSARTRPTPKFDADHASQAHFLPPTKPSHNNITKTAFCTSNLFIDLPGKFFHQLQGDDVPLDLVGSFIDLSNLGITHHLLHRVLFHITVTAEYLYSISGDAHRYVRSKNFGHRRFLGKTDR